jgi:nitroimidazol reductase NimA-like FMN-containing flavoprotein (pyridoxamine 5'-phosphate oxidase superfamily)
MPDVPGMNNSEIQDFLRNSETLLRLGTVDEAGAPMIHPVWYEYDDGSMYILTDRSSLKARNISTGGKVYFTVDTDTPPYKGVKGKASARVVKDSAKVQKIVERMLTKYTGGTDNEVGRSMIDGVKSGSQILFEIIPAYYSVWDYGKTDND